MAKLAVWSIDARAGESGSEPSNPKRAGRSNIGLERHLEDWIVKDVSLIGEGLTLVGRQVRIDDGRLDLLAIDSQDRWVVIEIKPDMLYSGAVTQAVYYASSLALLNGKDLHRKLVNQFKDEEDFRRKVGEWFDNPEALSMKVKKQVESEGKEREIVLMLVGAGISPGVERMSEFLGRFSIPIEIVGFEVFKSDNGSLLLVREVIEEAVEPRRPKRKYNVEAIRELAREAGVLEQLDRFMKMACRAGLTVQPQMTSIRIAPPKDKRRLLLYVEPMPETTDAGDGKLIFYWEPDAFKKYYGIDEQQVKEGLGELDDDRALSGEKIDERLDQIERFLTKHFPMPDADDA